MAWEWHGGRNIRHAALVDGHGIVDIAFVDDDQANATGHGDDAESAWKEPPQQSRSKFELVAIAHALTLSPTGLYVPSPFALSCRSPAYF